MNNFHSHFFSQGKAVIDSKIKGHTINFGQKNKGQIRDRTSKNLGKNGGRY